MRGFVVNSNLLGGPLTFMIYFEGLDPCSRDPCVNNGTCVDNGDNTFKCMCPPGVTGDRCQVRKKNGKYTCLSSLFVLFFLVILEKILFKIGGDSISSHFNKGRCFFYILMSVWTNSLEEKTRISPLKMLKPCLYIIIWTEKKYVVANKRFNLQSSSGCLNLDNGVFTLIIRF